MSTGLAQLLFGHANPLDGAFIGFQCGRISTYILVDRFHRLLPVSSPSFDKLGIADHILEFLDLRLLWGSYLVNLGHLLARSASVQIPIRSSMFTLSSPCTSSGEKYFI